MKITKIPQQKSGNNNNNNSDNNNSNNNNNNNNNNSLYQKVIGLNDNVVKCMGALVKHLKEFCLDKILKLSEENMQQFLKGDVMHLNGITINNLELFTNQSNGSIQSSLWWVLDKTSTAFGKRLLKTWVS